MPTCHLPIAESTRDRSSLSARNQTVARYEVSSCHCPGPGNGAGRFPHSDVCGTGPGWQPPAQREWISFPQGFPQPEDLRRLHVRQDWNIHRITVDANAAAKTKAYRHSRGPELSDSYNGLVWPLSNSSS